MPADVMLAKMADKQAPESAWSAGEIANETAMPTLPIDVWLAVVEYLPAESICKLLRVANFLRSTLVHDQSFWKLLYLRRFVDLDQTQVLACLAHLE